MTEISVISIVCIFVTIGLYLLFSLIQKRVNLVILNPVLLSIISIIAILYFTNIDYATYHQGSRFIEYLLKPAVVALGVPLYRQLSSIKKQFLPIFASQVIGSCVGIVSVILLYDLLSADKSIIISLVPKSVTTPIAIDISQICGGIPSLTAGVVVCVGILGAMFGEAILKYTRIKNPIAMGLAIGTASHAVGTSQAMKWSARYGAYSTVGLILNGILTAILAPYFIAIIMD